MARADQRRGRRVLGFFPHPDDEAYAAAGLLASCARAGAEVTVLCATRGEAGRDRRREATPGAELAALRTRELEQACEHIGARPPSFLDWPDGRIAELPWLASSEGLRALLGQLAPDVIVTLGVDGVYGHRDHLACTRMLAAAIEGMNLRVLHTAFPRGLFAPVWRHLTKVGGVVDLDVADLGSDEADVDLRFPVGDLRGVKLRAIAAHASQLRDGDPRSFLREGLIDALLDEEWYTVAAGPALPSGTTDPFDGLERDARAAPHP